MAEPISNLTSTWTDTVGIQLNWSAASDATVYSQYEVYVLTSTNSQVPTWNLVTSLSRNITKNQNTSGYTLVPPVTSYLYPWTAMQALVGSVATTYDPTGQGYPMPGSAHIMSIAFSIIHIDENGVESTAVNVSAFESSIRPQFSPPHLTNSIGIDQMRQFTVNGQDSYDEISSSVSMLLGTQLTQRSAVPSYGVPDFPFNNTDPIVIQNAISTWEPRAIAQVTVSYDSKNNEQVQVNLQIDASN